MASNEDYTSTTFQTGSKASIGTTAAQLVGTVTLKPRQGVYVRATPTNTVPVYIGKSTVTAGVAAPTTDGFPLYPTDPWVFFPCDNPAVLYGVTASSTGSVSFVIV